VQILTTSQNNWMRIKILKLFAALCPLVCLFVVTSLLSAVAVGAAPGQEAD
jgi:hypothetical protein